MRGAANTVGLDELLAMLGEMENRTEEIAKRALYQGAKVMADAYRKGVGSIKAVERGPGEDRHHARYPTPDEKEALDAIGIASFRGSGSEVDTLIGIGLGDEGYFEMDGKTKPLAMIARSINSGTSFMKKQPVLRKAASMAKGPAAAAVVQEAERIIREITK